MKFLKIMAILLIFSNILADDGSEYKIKAENGSDLTFTNDNEVGMKFDGFQVSTVIVIFKAQKSKKNKITLVISVLKKMQKPLKPYDIFNDAANLAKLIELTKKIQYYGFQFHER
jgi:hypothetical protein